MQALNAASHQQTTLLVTHQLEDTEDYDQIWVMDNGRIVQQGDYATLSAQPGLFATLIAHRRGSFNHARFAAVLALYRRHSLLISLGILLAIVTLLASIGLLALSGWFLAASSLAGLAGLLTFNYMLPAAGAARQSSAPPGAMQSESSATTPPSACCRICGCSPSARSCR